MPFKEKMLFKGKYGNIVLLFFLLVFSTCRKDKLTKATQTGANTFSCRINGQVFKPCETPGSLGFGGRPLYNGVSNTTVYIGARCHKDAFYDRKNIEISIHNFHGIGEYPLSNLDNSCIYEYDHTKYESKNSGAGKIVIAKDDRTNRILSGHFEFSASNSNNPNDIVKITEGKFDLSY